MLEKEQAANIYLLNILSKLKQFKDHEKLCDITLTIGYRQFKAHKAILAAWSPKLANLILPLNENKVNLVLNYKDVETFADVLDYLYSGCIGPEESNIRSLLDISKNLMIDPLVNICEDFLKTTTSLGNFVSRYFTSLKYSLTSLEKYITTFVETNIVFVIEQETLLFLPPQDLKCLLTMGKMAQAKQEIKFTIIVNWIGYNITERDKYLWYLAKNLHWNSSVKDLLLQLSTMENNFTQNEFCLFQLLYSITNATGHHLGPFTSVYPRLCSLYLPMMEELKSQDKHLISSIEVNMFNTIPIKVEELPPKGSSSSKSARPKTRDVEVNTDVDSSYFSEELEKSFIDKNIVDKTVDEKSVEEKSKTVMYEFETLNTPVNNYEDENEMRGNLVSSIEIDYDDADQLTDEIPEDVILETQTKKKKRKSKKADRDKNASKKKLNIKIKSKKLLKSEKYSLIPVMNDDQPSDLGNEPESVSHADSDNHDLDEVGNVDLENDVKLKATVKVEVENIEEFENGDVTKKLRIKSGVKRKRQSVKQKAGPKKVKQQTNKLGLKPEPRRPFMCTFEDCTFRSRSERGVSRHIASNHLVGVTLTCKKCDYSTTQMRLLCIHVKQHYPKLPYHCEEPDCSAKFFRINQLIRHQMSHMDEKPYKCDLCAKSFGQYSQLTHHKVLHEGRPFECDVCFKRFTTKGALQSHQAIHSDKKPYLCDTCGFSTKHLSHLISHRKIHTGNVLRCSFPNCDYSTPKQGHMTQHINTHLNIRNHICQVCGKSFVVRSKLLRHERIHLKEKLFKCKQCDYRTSRTDRMKLHIESHGLKFRRKQFNLPDVEEELRQTIDYHQMYEKVQPESNIESSTSSNGLNMNPASMGEMKMDALSLAASASMIVDNFSPVRLDQIGSTSVSTFEAAFQSYESDAWPGIK